jgi:hypothetical protein
MIWTMDAKQIGDEDETATTATADVGKIPPSGSMSAVDDSIMLPHSYQPKDQDVICR